jgi:hypothetical protein
LIFSIDASLSIRSARGAASRPQTASSGVQRTQISEVSAAETRIGVTAEKIDALFPKSFRIRTSRISLIQRAPKAAAAAKIQFFAKYLPQKARR